MFLKKKAQPEESKKPKKRKKRFKFSFVVLLFYALGFLSFLFLPLVKYEYQSIKKSFNGLDIIKGYTVSFDGIDPFVVKANILSIILIIGFVCALFLALSRSRIVRIVSALLCFGITCALYMNTFLLPDTILSVSKSNATIIVSCVFFMLASVSTLFKAILP